MSWQGEVLIAGTVQGSVLRLDAPLSFWGGVDPATSSITMAGHPQRGQQVAGKILVMPSLIGSSSSSAILLELIHGRRAPLALILGERDAILPIGVVVAQVMDWPDLPVLVVPEPDFTTGQRLSLALDGTIKEVP